MKIFENIECEWPLFFCYFLIDAVFREDKRDVRCTPNVLRTFNVFVGTNVIVETFYINKHLSSSYDELLYLL